MKKEIFIQAGAAAFGDSWQSQMQRALEIKNRQTISYWSDIHNSRQVPDLQDELLTILNVRKQEIDSAINALKTDYFEAKEHDFSKKYTVVSEGGYLLDERFDMLKDAQIWVDEEYDDEDQYLIKYHEMSEAENLAMLVIQEYADVYDPVLVLKEIQDEKNASEKKTEDIYCDLAVLIADSRDEMYARDYYKYYLFNELNINVIGFVFGEDEAPDWSETISYKAFVMRKVSEVTKFVAKEL